MPKDCIFCDVTTSTVTDAEFPENTILSQTESFYFKPALGAIVEGYGLLIPKKHQLGLAACSPQELQELSLFMHAVKQRLTDLYGQSVIFFEHGETTGAYAGSCISHGHMHVVAASVDIPHNAFLSVGKEHKLSTVTELHLFADEPLGYIFSMAKDGRITVYSIQQPMQCQYLRRVLAQAQHTPDLWDWQVWPERDSIRRFIEKFTEASRIT